MKKEHIAIGLVALFFVGGIGFWYGRSTDINLFGTGNVTPFATSTNGQPPSTRGSSEGASSTGNITPPPQGTANSNNVSFTKNSVGYLGCSMTVNAIEGYHSEGGTTLWGEVGDFGGGTISAWAGLLPTSKTYWSGFDAILAKNPGTKAVWMELCISVKKGGTANDTYENALVVRQEILKRIPNAVIYVSAQPMYTEGHVCGIAGADGPAKMQEIADKLVANGLAQKGPVLGPLATGQTADPCHANASGKSTMGKQMVEFFDK